MLRVLGNGTRELELLNGIRSDGGAVAGPYTLHGLAGAHCYPNPYAVEDAHRHGPDEALNGGDQDTRKHPAGVRLEVWLGCAGMHIKCLQRWK